jgi:hypothetical protein
MKQNKMAEQMTEQAPTVEYMTITDDMLKIEGRGRGAAGPSPDMLRLMAIPTGQAVVWTEGFSDRAIKTRLANLISAANRTCTDGTKFASRLHAGRLLALHLAAE